MPGHNPHLDRSLKKINDQIKAKDYYEASQLYLSVANRLFNNDPESGVQLFFEGCCVLAKEKQYEYVLALAKKLIQNVSGQNKIAESYRGIFGIIDSIFPKDVPEREEYRRCCISYFSSDEKHKDLCSDLYYLFGASEYLNKNFKAAEKNLVHSGKKGAILLGRISKKAFSSGDGKLKSAAAMILLHAVVGYLSSSDVQSAETLLLAFEGTHSDTEKYWEDKSIKFKKAKNSGNSTVNLTQVIFLAVLSGNEMLYKYIAQNYTNYLYSLDEKLPEMTANIQSLYFHTTPPPLMSLFENFKNLI